MTYTYGGSQLIGYDRQRAVYRTVSSRQNTADESAGQGHPTDSLAMMPGSSVRLDFQSSLDMLDLVHTVSNHMGKAAGLDEDANHWLCMAIRECVVNAITHGNSNDTRKRVHLEFTPFEDQGGPGVAIRVRDEGAGFDPDNVPDCCAPENLLKSGGRGIFLIRSFMDELDLRRAPEGGMEVVMVKRAQPLQA